MSTMTHSTPRLSRYFDAYQSYHHHPLNKLTHYVGIPIIVLALEGLLSAISLGAPLAGGFIAFDLGLVLLGIATTFYLWLDWRIGLPFSLVMLGFYICGRQLMLASAWPLLWGLFIFGWILQFVGHYKYERQSPAFMKNLEHLLVGPIWIFARLVGYYH